MANDNGSEDLSIVVGGDLSPLQQALDQIPQVAQDAAARISAALGGASAPVDALAGAANNAAAGIANAGAAAASANQPVDQFGEAMRRITEEFQNQQRASQDAAANLQMVQAAFAEGTASAGQLEQAFQKLEAAERSITGTTQTMQQQMQDLSMEMLKTGAAVSAISVPLGALGLSAIKTAGEFEQSQIAFETLLHSASEGRKLLNDLIDFAIKTPFEIKGLVETGQKLLAVGYDAKTIIPTLTTLGDAASLLGKGQPGLVQLVNIFAKLKTEVNLTQREILQFTNANIDAIKILSEHWNVDVGTLRKDITAGLVKTADAVPVLLAAMNEQFGGGMQKLSETALGAWSNIKDQITKTLKAIGDQLLPFVKQFEEFLSQVLSVVQTAAEAFGKLPEPIKDFTIALAALTAIAGPALVAIGALTLALSVVSVPVLIATGEAIVALAAALALLHFNSDNVKAWWQEILNLKDAVMGSNDVNREAIAANEALIQKQIEGKLSTADLSHEMLNFRDELDKMPNAIQNFTRNLEEWTGVYKSMITANKTVASELRNTNDQIKAQADAVTAATSGVGSYSHTLTELGIKNKQLQDAVTAAQKEISNLNKAAKEGFDVTAQLAVAHDKLKAALAAQHPELKQTGDETVKLTQAQKDQITGAKDLEKGQSQLAAMYKALGSSLLPDAATAARNLADAWAANQAATEKLAAAEVNYQNVLRDEPNNHRAILAARQQEEAASQAATITERNLIAAQQVSAQVARDLAAANTAIAESHKAIAAAVNTMSKPALKSEDDALAELNDAYSKQATQIGIVTLAQEALDQERSKTTVSEKNLADLESDLKTKRQALAEATGEVTRSQNEYNTAQQRSHAVTQQIIADQEALDKYFSSSKLGQYFQSFSDGLNAVRQANDNAATAAKNLQTALDNLKAVSEQEGAASDAARIAARQAADAKTALAAAETHVGQVIGEVNKQFGASKDALDRMRSSSDSAKQGAMDLNAALSTLGLKSVDTLDKEIQGQKEILAVLQAQGAPVVAQLEAQQRLLQLEMQRAQASGASASDIGKIAVQMTAVNLQLDAARQKTMGWADAWNQAVAAAKQMASTLTNDLAGLGSDLVNLSVFGNKNNDQLDKQMADLKSQLAEATTTYQQYLADYATTVAGLKQQENQAVIDTQNAIAATTTANAAAQAKEIQALRSSLSQKVQAYEAYANNVQQQIAQIKTDDSASLNTDLQSLRDALAQKSAAYDQYVAGVNVTLQRIGQDTQASIDAQTTTTQRGIQDQATALQRAQEDTATKIQRLRDAETAANHDQTEQQIQDLQSALAQKQQDYQTYYSRASADLAKFTADAKAKAQQQIADTNAALQQQLEAQAKAIAEESAAEQKTVATHKAAVDKQTADLMAGLAAQQDALNQANIATEQGIADVTAKYAQQQADQVKALQDALTQKEQALQDQEAAAAKALADTTKTYDKFVATTTAQLDELVKEHVTAWSLITQGFQKLAEDLLDIAVKQIITGALKPLLTELGSSISGLLGFQKIGETATKSVTDAMANASKSMQDFATATTQSMQNAAQATKSGTDSILSSFQNLLPTLQLVTGIINAVASIIADIQLAHTNKLLGEIEVTTRQMANILGLNGAESILGYTHQTANILSSIQDMLWNPIVSLLNSISGNLDGIAYNATLEVAILTLLARSGVSGGSGGGGLSIVVQPMSQFIGSLDTANKSASEMSQTFGNVSNAFASTFQDTTETLTTASNQLASATSGAVGIINGISMSPQATTAAQAVQAAVKPNGVGIDAGTVVIRPTQPFQFGGPEGQVGNPVAGVGLARDPTKSAQMQAATNSMVLNVNVSAGNVVGNGGITQFANQISDIVVQGLRRQAGLLKM